MIVYRLCTYGEVQEILQNQNMLSVGKAGKDLISIQQTQNVSSHNYNFQKNYLHFYPEKSYVFYLNVDSNCICTYNIPDELLADRLGEGYYLDLANHRRKVRIPEYSVDVSLLSFDYLEKVEYAREYIDIDDYFADSTLTECVDVLYNKEKGIIRERRVS